MSFITYSRSVSLSDRITVGPLVRRNRLDRSGQGRVSPRACLVRERCHPSVDGGRPPVDPRCPSRQRQAPSSRSLLSTECDSIADCLAFAGLEVGSRGPSRPGQVPDLEYSREDTKWGLSDLIPRPIRVFRSPSAVLDIRWGVWKLMAAGRCRLLGQSD